MLFLLGYLLKDSMIRIFIFILGFVLFDFLVYYKINFRSFNAIKVDFRLYFKYLSSLILKRFLIFTSVFLIYLIFILISVFITNKFVYSILFMLFTFLALLVLIIFYFALFTSEYNIILKKYTIIKALKESFNFSKENFNFVFVVISLSCILFLFGSFIGYYFLNLIGFFTFSFFKTNISFLVTGIYIVVLYLMFVIKICFITDLYKLKFLNLKKFVLKKVCKKTKNIRKKKDVKN
jgi:hypothetical protein